MNQLFPFHRSKDILRLARLWRTSFLKKKKRVSALFSAFNWLNWGSKQQLSFFSFLSTQKTCMPATRGSPTWKIPLVLQTTVQLVGSWWPQEPLSLKEHNLSVLSASQLSLETNFVANYAISGMAQDGPRYYYRWILVSSPSSVKTQSGA